MTSLAGWLRGERPVKETDNANSFTDIAGVFGASKAQLQRRAY
jgi:hypothetical protein